MHNEEATSEAVRAIHQAIEQAEYALSKLGDNVQFLIGAEGRVEVVRRSKTGRAVQPKEVVLELQGFDPMLWSAESLPWYKTMNLVGMEIEPAIGGADDQESWAQPPDSSEDNGETEPLLGPRLVTES